MNLYPSITKVFRKEPLNLLDLLVQFFGGHVFLHLTTQLEEFEESCCVEEVVPCLPKHERQLLIVVCHCFRHRTLLRHVHQTVDVLNGLVGFLNQNGTGIILLHISMYCHFRQTG